MPRTTHAYQRNRLLCSTALAIVGLALCVPSTAYAQDSSQVETVVVTGSRLQSRGFDAPTPVSVIDSDEITFSGTINVEQLLSVSPQFLGAREGTSSSNTIQANGDGGAAYTNLHGLGATRTLVLVNNRRYVVQGTSLSTDLNTIPSALIERTEVVTGGSSAVYGSDAIAGVINFIMKQNYEGVTGTAQYKFDQATTTPIYNLDLTIGGNFANNRGNVVLAIDYLSRKGFTQGQHGGFTGVQYRDGCVTKESFSYTHAGTALSGVSTGAACVAAGGVNGLIKGGSTNIPNGGFYGITTYANADSTLKALYTAAGLTGITSDGFTFDDAGTTARLRNTTTDVYNLIADNYMQMPQQRWMMNSFAHYDFSPQMTGYAEFHFSSNTVNAQLTPGGISGTFLVDADNPYLSTQLQSVLAYLDSQETTTKTVTAGTSTFTTTANDGIAAITLTRRLVENGYRRNAAKRVAWRFAGGFRGDLGNAFTDYLQDLKYDVYYSFSRTDETDTQGGSISKSAFQKALLSQNGADPVCNIFGQNMSDECIAAITIGSTVQTHAEMQNVVASFSGSALNLPAGPLDFVVGTEWRYYHADYIPDKYTMSGDVAGLNSSTATDGSVSVRELFGEVRIPVLSDLPLVKKLTVNSAVRYSSYNIAGARGVWTYSAGSDWRMFDDLNLRGQFQHAIRAPNVADLYGGSATNKASGTADPCGIKNTSRQTATVRALCIASGVAAGDVFTSAVQGTNDLLAYVSGGNEDLKPERADTITLGAVYTPEWVPGLVTSVDFYSIYVKDAIGSLAGGLGGVLSTCYYDVQDINSAYCQAIHRDANGTLNGDGYVSTGNANIAAIKNQGIDLEAQYSFNVDWGLFGSESTVNIQTSWTWILESVSISDQDDMADRSNGAGTYGTPRWKGVTRYTWQDGPLSLSLRHRFISSMFNGNYRYNIMDGLTDSLANYTRGVLPAMHYFDLSATYDINDKIQVFGGISNLFDKDPPILGDSASYDNTLPETYDVYGRVFNIGITAKTN